MNGRTVQEILLDTVEESAARRGWHRGFSLGFLTGVVVVGFLLVVTACAAVEVHEENGPLGPASIKVTPPALIHRASKARRVEATATTPATTEEECESGVCRVPGTR